MHLPLPDAATLESKMASSDRLALRYAIVVGLVHCIVVSCSLVPGWRVISLLDGDAQTYLRPAENLVEHLVFSGAPRPPFFWEPYRTPSYPLLIALSLLLWQGYQWVLYFAAVTAGVAAWCGVKLVQEWNGSRLAAGAAGLAFALLPDSLGFSAEMMTDAIFGHLVLVWIYLLWTGLRSASYSRLVGCAALTVFLQGLKPTFNLAFVLLARGKRQWLSVGALRMSPARSLAGRLYAVKKDAVAGFLRDHPGAVAALAVTEMLRQFVAPEGRVFHLFSRRLAWRTTLLGSLLSLSLFACAAYGGHRLWRGGDPRPPLLVLGVLLFFLVTGSVSHRVGTRLRFPADMVTIPLAAIGFAGMIRRKESP